MALRILLSLAMLIPAAPVKPEARECPFTSVEECRAWLEKCCGAGDRVREFCQILDDDCGDNREAARSSGCCSDEEQIASQSACGGGSCSSEAQGSSEEESESCCVSTLRADEPSSSDDCSPDSPAVETDHSGLQKTVFACSAHTSPGMGAMECLWCCCCPPRPIRLPDPQPTPVTQRSTLEKVKVEKDSGPGAIQTLVHTPPLQFLNAPIVPLPSSTRQAILCVWLN